MHRPVVLLPLPDSPTRPNISPSSMTKLTSSTALTTDGDRPSAPDRAKCLTRWRTSRSGITRGRRLKPGHRCEDGSHLQIAHPGRPQGDDAYSRVPAREESGGQV